MGLESSVVNSDLCQKWKDTGVLKVLLADLILFDMHFSSSFRAFKKHQLFKSAVILLPHTPKIFIELEALRVDWQSRNWPMSIVLDPSDEVTIRHTIFKVPTASIYPVSFVTLGLCDCEFRIHSVLFLCEWNLTRIFNYKHGVQWIS